MDNQLHTCQGCCQEFKVEVARPRDRPDRVGRAPPPRRGRHAGRRGPGRRDRAVDRGRTRPGGGRGDGRARGPDRGRGAVGRGPAEVAGRLYPLAHEREIRAPAPGRLLLRGRLLRRRSHVESPVRGGLVVRVNGAAQ